MTDTSNSK